VRNKTPDERKERIVSESRTTQPVEHPDNNKRHAVGHDGGAVKAGVLWRKNQEPEYYIQARPRSGTTTSSGIHCCYTYRLLVQR
jgi:hypothetical protein